MNKYPEMMDGPKHVPHVRQVQVGWLGQSGAFYPWPTVPTRGQEPGSYGPVFIDEEEGPALPCLADLELLRAELSRFTTSKAWDELETLRGIAKRLRDGWSVGACSSNALWSHWDHIAEPMTEAEVYIIYRQKESED